MKIEKRRIKSKRPRSRKTEEVREGHRIPDNGIHKQKHVAETFEVGVMGQGWAPVGFT